MTTTPCPADCGRTRESDKYLCRTCWFELPAETRRTLNRRGAGAIHRYLRLIDQIHDGMPLDTIRIT